MNKWHRLEVIGIKTAIFKAGEDLTRFLIDQLPRLKEKDVLIVTSKIVALSQSLVVPLDKKSKSFWIKKESDLAVKTKWAYLTKRGADWLINSGVDESNARGRLILLPRKPFDLAWQIRLVLKKIFGLKRLGVILTDTRSRPLRSGTTGVALAYAGIHGLKDYQGSRDLFGRKLKYTKTNAADALAAAAGLVMGEAAERRPLALVRRAPIDFTDRRPRSEELFILPAGDMYRRAFRPGGARRSHAPARRRRTKRASQQAYPTT